MSPRRALPAAGFILAALLGLAPPAAGQAPPPTAERVAAQKLQKAQELYAAGSYQECRDLVEQYLQDYRANAALYPSGIMARIYRLDALLAYTFREEGYVDEIGKLLRTAIALDLDLDIGDPAEVPPFVIDAFNKVRSAYLAQFARMARRSALGLSWALVLEPTVFQDISLIQPGISYTFNITEAFSLDAEMRFPLQLPIWSSIRGQVGLLWFPSFRVDKIITGVSFYYIFGLDELSTYTHSLSFGGRMEYVARSGFGIGGNAELLRADLVFGSQTPASPPSYTQMPFLGLGRVVFANITLYAFYVF